jgi:hypothetical protein
MSEPIDRRFDPSRRFPEDPGGGPDRPGRTTESFAAHDVIATLADMSTARLAVQKLQLAGIDASQISLFGPAAEEAAADTTVSGADAALADVLWRRTWVGALLGALAGAFVGAGGAALVLQDVWADAIGVFWAAVVGTAVLGLGTGAATGATSTAQMSRAWELTFHSVAPGRVGVAVHTEDARESARAELILGRFAPSQLERFDLGRAGPGPPDDVRS